MEYIVKKYNPNMLDENPVVYRGSRGDDFKKIIRDVLVKSNLKSHYIDLLMSEDSLKVYNDVFTSNTADMENNYEMYEQMGDVLAGSFIIWYMYRRFPHLQCSEAVKIVARLKINYGARQSFFGIGEKLGFWPFITATEEERNREKKDLLEDTLEAFIGATAFILDNNLQHGVGYAVVYNILSSIFDEMDISLKYEDLYDPITRLKETFDYFKDRIGIQEKHSVKDEKLTTFTLFRVFQGRKDEIGVGVAAKKPDAEQKAATQALEYLKLKGFLKPTPSLYIKYDKSSLNTKEQKTFENIKLRFDNRKCVSLKTIVGLSNINGNVLNAFIKDGYNIIYDSNDIIIKMK